MEQFVFKVDAVCPKVKTGLHVKCGDPLGLDPKTGVSVICPCEGTVTGCKFDEIEHAIEIFIKPQSN